MSGYTATCILNFGTRCEWSASGHTDMKLYSNGQSLVSTEQEAVGPQSWYGQYGEEKNLCLLQAIKRFLIHQSNSWLTIMSTLSQTLLFTGKLKINRFTKRTQLMIKAYISSWSLA